MKLLGHRGASADFPENTLEAFEGAVQQGADGVELDVMRCGTGELVVYHDEWLDRLAGIHREVAKTPWRTLKTLDVGSTLGFPPARIPRLEDVFDVLPDTFAVNVELKCETLDDRGLALEVGRFLSERRRDGVFVSSFNPWCLMRLVQAFPALPRGLLIDPDKPWFPQAAVWLPLVAKTSVHPPFEACTEQRVANWHARGFEVVPWTVDDPAEARRLRALDVDWLITNEPGRLRRALESGSRASSSD
jgi:glycerophosphoryl diester phosphodiesterase